MNLLNTLKRYVNKKKVKHREAVNLSLAVILSISFAIFSLSVYYINRIYNYFYEYNSLPITEVLIDSIFLWLAIVLWVTYHRWIIAERKRRERKQIAMSISPDVIIDIDDDRNIIRCDTSIKRMFGYEVDEVINQKTDMLYFDRRADTSLRYEIHDKLEKDGFHIGVATGRKKNGDTILLEIITRNFSLQKGAMLLLRDITEHKRSEEKFRNLIEHANDAIISTNKEGMIVGFNKKAEEMFGYIREELLGKPVTLLASQNSKKENIRDSEESDTNSELFRSQKPIEGKGLRKDGKEILIESSAYTLDIHGECIITSVIRDITERKQMEKKLLQSEKLKSLGELSGGVAHDFNNLLAVILGRIQLVRKHIEVPPGVKERRKSALNIEEDIVVIERAALDGAETVRRIQEFSRRKSDSDMELTQTDVNELIENTLEFTRVRWETDAEEKGIVINLKKELTPLPSINGRPSELREVFTNIINNALDAMPEGGELRIKSFLENGFGVVVIQDTGMGISHNIKDRIFDPFFTTKGVKSTGLGLSVSYGIINRHHGTIAVKSKESCGTTFTIRLPIAESTGKQVAKKENISAITGKQKKARVLICEDEEDVRQLLSDVLIDCGHEVEVTSDGKEGIKLFEENEFDMVLTDLGMPGMSGWEIAEKIKGINGNIPIAFITGWNVKLNESKGQDKVVDFVLQKPFKIQQISELVQKGIALREKLSKAI